MEDCLFCKIVSGDAPSYKVWEDKEHLAFLSIFPNTDGVTVVITKEHNDSYVFSIPETKMLNLIRAAKKVALGIDSAFEDVGRTSLVFEGFGVNHLHAKLFPMHGTNDESWKQNISYIDKYFEKYEGYISSHDYKEADQSKLKKTADKIRSAINSR